MWISKIILGCALLLGISANSLAQLKVEITGVGATQYPTAVVSFVGEPSASADPLSAIIRADLLRSGMFKLIDHGGVALSETNAVNSADWKSKGADTIAVGSATRLADGRWDIRYRLLDNVKQTQLDGVQFTANPADLRLIAHKIADRIYEKITGEKGVFATRIAYVQKAGPNYELIIADSDGANPQAALRSREPIISPSWSPDGGRLAYVSFESRKPVVYVHTVATGGRVPVANFKGNNSAPAWSPDGRQLAVVLTKDGLSQIYLMSADGSGVRRLTNSPGIDTEPRFSPDGGSIYFTSDRGGSPQIYRMAASGSDASRVTFKGDYNISPRISADGKTLSYVTRRGGKFQIAALDLSNGNELLLTEGPKDESPSFAPNGKLILYASDTRNRDTLAIVSVDGRVRQQITSISADIREPTWGPFLP